MTDLHDTIDLRPAPRTASPLVLGVLSAVAIGVTTTLIRRTGVDMSEQEPPQSQSFTLCAGEQRVLRVAAGSRCIVVRGELRLIEPARWLGEQVVRLEHVLGQGTEHVLEPGGWITLQALTDGALRLESPASLVSAVLGALRIARPGPATA